MADPRPARPKRPRGRYSRLICLGCRDRRIRCELPDEIETPNPGELRTAQVPCYRCRRLGLPCVIRQTILGRPGHENGPPTARTGDIVSRIIIEFPSRPTSLTLQNETQVVNNPTRKNRSTLFIHTPQSMETAIIIRAIDTLRREKVEDEWFRHLPAHAGHTQALDLSIRAIVAACAYSRGVPKITSGDCYQALAVALNAVQADIKQSHGKPNDDILASTALLAPFEGVIRKNGIVTSLHVEGLAAILAARPVIYPVTQIAREILDFHACESAIMACVQDTPSPFERIPRAYFANNRVGYSDSDQAQLKGLGNELFIHIPRLVCLARSWRLQPSQRNQLLLDALRLSKSLHRLQDSQAEERLLRSAKIQASNEHDAVLSLHHSLHFASVKDFEALAYYWQGRLSLLRLEWHLYGMSASSHVHADSIIEPGFSFQPSFGPRSNEISRVMKNIIMCLEYAGALPLRKHHRMLAHAMVVAWGARKDVQMVLGDDQGVEGAESLSNLLLRRTNIALEAKPALTAADMDVAADIFLGGKPTGRFAELYGL